MKGNRETGKLLWKIAQAGMILCTLLAFIKGIWISLDIDESYAVAQSYRLACGDRLLADMWESHQLSAFLGALFIKPYLFLFHTTDYLVIYLRVIGILIHTGLGIWLYRWLKTEFSPKLCFLLLFLHLNFLPKWVQVPEFELMHYWFLLAVFLLLFRYFTDSQTKRRYPFLAGVCLVGSMMCYPTMILLYPFYFLGLCVLEKQKHGKTGAGVFGSSLLFTAGAAAAGTGFLVYLFSYQSFEEFRRYISYIFLDESHTMYSTADKWLNYAGQLKQHCMWYLKYAVAAVLVVGILLFLGVVFLKIKKKPLKPFFTVKNAEPLFLAILLFTALGMQANQILGCLFKDQNQFYLQIRYIAVILPAVYLGIRYHKKMSVLFYLCILPSLLSLPAVLAITNMNISVTYSRAFLGVLGSLLMLSVYCRERSARKQGTSDDAKDMTGGTHILLWVLGIGLLLGFFVCKLVLIRVTGCLPVTVLAPLEPLREGPAKGIYVLEQEARIWNENYRVIQETIDKEDRLLYIGAENLVYPAAGCMAATPSTQGTAVYNEMFLYYFEEHPERLPNVIIIDKTFGVNPVYYYSPSNEILFRWIEENYADAELTETDYLKILRD